MKFIVFEGLDGAGKSTLIHKIEAHLAQKSSRSILVRDPGTTSVGEKLRHVILDPAEKPVARTEILMYEAARAQMVEEVIRPHLEKSYWVLSDRFYSSTIAFQCSARGISRSDVDWLNNYACNGLQPDLVVFIDIPVEESLRRLKQRNDANGNAPDRMEKENTAFHQAVREGYLMQARENPKGWLVLDGRRTPDQLFDDVLAHFKERQWPV